MLPNMAQVVSEPVRWLWEGRIPLGKVTLLEGDPGIGKSTLALDLAAKVSQGAQMPYSKAGPSGASDVVLFSGDDDLGDTVRPRLEAANADLTRIRPIDREVKLTDVEAIRPALIILDPLSSYFCLACEQTPRDLMQSIARLARDSDAAVLVVQSLPSREDSEWAREIYSVARSVLTITTIGLSGRRLAVSKSNLRSTSEVLPLVYHHDGRDEVLRIIGWSDGR
ncbi:AAA family ATPase [Singulisphaera sp. PoT]|uniref:AAA family ATPase n=1 Tax=Singulisphaera sp. PoT TaxID=3411797 RepID=UPI003BF5B8E6